MCALYPDLMNIYADRGNLLMLERRCRWRDIGFVTTAAGLGEELDPDGAGPAAQCGTAAAHDHVLAGFENHGGRTQLGAEALALGRVLKGHGNDGRSGLEGARRGSIVGTYLHGPLLPKNAWFADWLIARALAIEAAELAPLDDRIERAAHLGARRAAGV